MTVLLAAACQPGAGPGQTAAAPTGLYDTLPCVRVSYSLHGQVPQPCRLCVLLMADTLANGLRHSVWILADSSGYRELLGSSLTNPDFPQNAYQIQFSPDGRYGALACAGEGHPWLEVFSVDSLLATRRYDYRNAHDLNPYPGGVELLGWRGSRLTFTSEMPFDSLASDTARFDMEQFERNEGQYKRFYYDPATRKFGRE
ncbi:MAG: hypothetical protein MUC97_01810 [Bernardetiaceae bacterium]|nr:hypothetical protein [Bernardetiaceae bacterium]